MEASYSDHIFLLITISLTFFSSSTTTKATHTQPNPTNDFIKTSCSTTAYPKLCYNSLSTHASLIQTSPKLLCNAALNVTLTMAKSSSTTIQQLSKSKGMNSRVVGAMVDCVEELSDAVYELKRSMDEMGGQINESNFGLIMSDLETWVSAALTDETTCSDGFQGKDVDVSMKDFVRGQVLKMTHLTSNALALINGYASLRH